MRKAILPAVALAAVVALWWFLHDAEGAGEAEATESAGGSTRAFEKDFDRLKQRLNAFSSAEVKPPQGDLEIRGRVLGPQGPVPNAVVTATQPVAGETLSALACHCGYKCGLPMLECGCPEAAAQLMELVVDRRGEAPPIARATTDGEGQYVLRGLAAGAYTLWADAPSGIGVRGGVKAGDGAADVDLAPGRVIRGVVRGEDKQPIAGAVVTAIHAKHSRFFDALTGADGKFQIGPVPSGKFQVVAASRELLPDNEAVGDRDKELELTLYAPRRLAGLVLKNGAPVPDARVSIDGQHRKGDLRSARDGAFAFERLRPGEYRVDALDGREQASASVTIVAGTDPEPLRLELFAGAELRGTAQSKDGAPVAGAEVRIQVETQSGSITRTAKTDSSGALVVTGLPPGEASLALTADDFVDPEGQTVTLAGGGTEEVHWTLERATLLTGVVLDADGNPLASAGVAARPAAAAGSDGELSPGYARSAADGTFRLKLAAPGDYDVRAHRDGLIAAKKTVHAPSAGLELRLGAGLQLKGVVLDPSGAPAAGANVSLTPSMEGTDLSEPDDIPYVQPIEAGDDGRFEFRGLVAGKYSATAEHAQGYAKVDVTLPSPAPLELRLSEGKVIAGRVVTAAGQPLKEALVRLAIVDPTDGDRSSADGRLQGTADTDDRGAFAIKGLEDGRYRITAYKDGFTAPDEPALVRTGERDVRLVLESTPHARGRVVDDAGKPIPRFKIDGDEHEDAAGQFELPIYRTEEWHLVFDAGAGYAQTSRTVKVVAGKDASLGDVVIGRGIVLRGRVIDHATRAPIAGALVDVGDPVAPGELVRSELSARSGAVATRADGAFELPHVDASRSLWVFAQHEDYPIQGQPFAAGESPVIELRKGGAISGRVLSASGAPLKAEVFAMVPGKGAPGDADTAADGSFRIEGLPAADYHVVVALDDEQSSRFSPVAARVELGSEVDVELRERSGGATIRIRVVAEASGYTFAVLAPGRSSVPKDAEALFTAETAAIQPRGHGEDVNTFEAISPGTYTVLYGASTDEGLRVAASPLQVSGDRELSLEIPKDATLFTKEALRGGE